MPVCYIVGAAETELHISPSPDDLVIAADAGYLMLKEAGIEPGLIVGDFDSLGIIPQGANVVRHPVMKDDTDTLLAVRLGLDRGLKEFHIYGGMGGRTDHTIANLQTLAFIVNQGAKGFLYGGGETVTVIKNDILRFPAEMKGTVSVFALCGEARGVYERGLLFSLTDATLTPDFPVGVSNEFCDKESSIEVRDGCLTVIWS